AAEVDVAPVAVDDLQAADLAVADLQTGEIAQVDAGVAELIALNVLTGHGGQYPAPVPPCTMAVATTCSSQVWSGPLHGGGLGLAVAYRSRTGALRVGRAGRESPGRRCVDDEGC